jgi:hypothetical protein
MGSYDDVNFSMPCPICKKEISGFQTKDLSCSFETVNFWECERFYSSCDYCNTWIDFVYKREKKKIFIEDYEIRMELNNCPEDRITRNSEGKITGFLGQFKKT